MEELNNLNYNIEIINNYDKLIKNLTYYNNYFSPSLIEMTKNLEEYARKLYENAITFEIINEKKERLGIISFYANDHISNIAFITIIVVDKNYSNCGIGSFLIEYAEKYCKSIGMKKMRLEVNKNNKNALKFYEKHNYHIENEKDNTYYMLKEI